MPHRTGGTSPVSVGAPAHQLGVGEGSFVWVGPGDGSSVGGVVVGGGVGGGVVGGGVVATVMVTVRPPGAVVPGSGSCWVTVSGSVSGPPCSTDTLNPASTSSSRASGRFR